MSPRTCTPRANRPARSSPTVDLPEAEMPVRRIATCSSNNDTEPDRSDHRSATASSFDHTSGLTRSGTDSRVPRCRCAPRAAGSRSPRRTPRSLRTPRTRPTVRRSSPGAASRRRRAGRPRPRSTRRRPMPLRCRSRRTASSSISAATGVWWRTRHTPTTRRRQTRRRVGSVRAPPRCSRAPTPRSRTTPAGRAGSRRPHRASARP